jgi:hypothetical protein
MMLCQSASKPSMQHIDLIFFHTLLAKEHLKNKWSLFSILALHSKHKESHLITQLASLSFVESRFLIANQVMKANLGIA